MVSYHNRNNLVIGFPFINHLESTDWNCFHQHSSRVNIVRTQHTDIERVMIPHIYIFRTACNRKFHHFIMTVSSRNESVQRRDDIRKLLWTVHLQVTTGFINLIFYGITGNDLHKNVHHVRRIGTCGNPVPWMCFKIWYHYHLNLIVLLSNQKDLSSQSFDILRDEILSVHVIHEEDGLEIRQVRLFTKTFIRIVQHFQHCVLRIHNICP